MADTKQWLKEFHTAPVETTMGITHPAGRGWKEAIQKAFATRLPSAPRASTFEAARSFFVGWGGKYMMVNRVAVEFALSGWTVTVLNTYSFRAERGDGKGFNAIDGQTKACWPKAAKEPEHCWYFYTGQYQ